MTQEIALFKGGNLPLVNDALANVEKMKEFCQLILDSKLAPDHFYPKIQGSNDRDYTKGNIAAVMMVGIHGSQLGLPFMTALQQVVPVNGLMSIKGDGAKSLILNSGVVKPGSWKETEEGSLTNGTYAVTISAERIDNGEKLSRSFSVEHAKKAGLWVTDEMLKAQDGYKWKKSSWYKYPDRMIKYRALGFLARDLFPDVMAGTYTEEEARDIPRDTTQVIDTAEGAKIILPDKQFAQERSQSLTQKAIDKIDKHQNGGSTHDNIANDPVLRSTDRDEAGKGVAEEGYTEAELKTKSVEELLPIIEVIPDLQFAMSVIEGKNTNKKLREIILAYQKNVLADMVHPHILPSQQEPEAVDALVEEDNVSDMPPMEEITGASDEQQSEVPPGDKARTHDDPIFPSTVIDLPEGGQREFSNAAKLYGALNTMVSPQITDKRFLDIVGKISDFALRFKDKESFCKAATWEEIKELIKQNEIL